MNIAFVQAIKQAFRDIEELKKRGKIPPKTQAWIQVKTKGELLAEEEDENSNPLA